MLRVNPALKPQDYAEAFRRDGVVQIDNFFELPAAERLAKALKDDTAWQITYPDETGGSRVLTGQDVASLDAEKAQRFLAGIIQRASNGFSYIYLACHLGGTYGSLSKADHPLHDLYHFLNARDFIDFACAVTGDVGVDKVDAAATCYRAGDFLAVHNDTGNGRRRAAYTLGFTKGWRSDWGGQLLFHDKTGEITRGLLPRFNVLTLFKTPSDHSVAQVATYATQPRLAVTGWLLDGTAPQR